MKVDYSSYEYNSYYNEHIYCITYELNTNAKDISYGNFFIVKIENDKISVTPTATGL